MIKSSLHKGDDIAVFVDNWLHCVMINTAMRVSGHEGNDLKLLIGDGQIEFLRKDYMNDNCIYGFLNRAIPNIVTSDL